MALAHLGSSFSDYCAWYGTDSAIAGRVSPTCSAGSVLVPIDLGAPDWYVGRVVVPGLALPALSTQFGVNFNRVVRADIGVVVDSSARQLEGFGASVIRSRQTAAFTDPPCDELIVQMMVSGPDETNRVGINYGDGAFSMPCVAGGTAVSPPNTQAEYVGSFPFELICIAIPSASVAEIRRESGGLDSPFMGAVHASAFMDPSICKAILQLTSAALHRATVDPLLTDHLTMTVVRYLDRRSGALTSFPRSDRKLSAERLGIIVDYMRDNISRPIKPRRSRTRREDGPI